MLAPTLVIMIAIDPKMVSPKVPALESPRNPVNMSVPPSRSEGEASAHLRLDIMSPMLSKRNGTTNMVQPKALFKTE